MTTKEITTSQVIATAACSSSRRGAESATFAVTVPTPTTSGRFVSLRALTFSFWAQMTHGARVMPANAPGLLRMAGRVVPRGPVANVAHPSIRSRGISKDR